MPKFNKKTEDLGSVTTKLGEAYRQWKDGEKEKEKLRKKFFDLARQENSKNLAQKSITIDTQNEDEAREYIAREYPTWDVEKLEEKNNGYRAIIRESPNYRDFVFSNDDDGYVYRYQVTEGATLVDDERLQSEQPDLWESISAEVVTRVLKPLDELTDDQLAKLQDYVYKGKPQVKLAPPRPIKDEDLEDK